MPTTTLKSPKAAPKKVAKAAAAVTSVTPATKSKVAKPKVVEPAIVEATVVKPAPQLTVAEIREAFAAYSPDLRTATNHGFNGFKVVLPGTKLARPIHLDKSFVDTGKSPYGTAPMTEVFDFKTLKKPAPKTPVLGLPFWWQVQQGLHPVLPKVENLPKFLLEWYKDLIKDQPGKPGVYCGGHDMAGLKYRFCNTTTNICPTPEVVQRYRACLQDITQHYFGSEFSTVYAATGGSSGSGSVKDPLTVPQATAEEIKGYVKAAQAFNTGFVVEAPSALEFEDNTEMLARVMDHCSQIPGFKVHYLRKMMAGYVSDGHMSKHPTAFNFKNGKVLMSSNDVDDPTKTLILSKGEDGYTALSSASVPVMYFGPMWCISFSMLETYVCSQNMVYFAEWDDFEAAYKANKPEELEHVPKFADLVFICSHWCERNSQRNYGSGIELQTPIERQLSLRNWILGPFLERTLRSKKLPGVTTYSGAMTAKKIEVAERLSILNDKSVIKARVTPVWAKHLATRDK